MYVHGTLPAFSMGIALQGPTLSLPCQGHQSKVLCAIEGMVTTKWNILSHDYDVVASLMMEWGWGDYDVNMCNSVHTNIGVLGPDN